MVSFFVVVKSSILDFILLNLLLVFHHLFFVFFFCSILFSYYIYSNTCNCCILISGMYNSCIIAANIRLSFFLRICAFWFSVHKCVYVCGLWNQVWNRIFIILNIHCSTTPASNSYTHIVHRFLMFSPFIPIKIY